MVVAGLLVILALLGLLLPNSKWSVHKQALRISSPTEQSTGDGENIIMVLAMEHPRALLQPAGLKTSLAPA